MQNNGAVLTRINVAPHGSPTNRERFVYKKSTTVLKNRVLLPEYEMARRTPNGDWGDAEP